MAIPLTPSRFAHSLSFAPPSRAPLSMADTLPSADFNFDDLRQRMSAFTLRFDDFIAKGRKRVLEERNAFRANVAELEESHRSAAQQISSLQTASSTHATTLEKESAEKEDLESAISSLQSQRSSHLALRTELQASLSHSRARLTTLRAQQAEHQAALAAQARENAPELAFWERTLGLRVEGAGGEVLRFVFDGVGDGREECWFELNTGSEEFEVGATEPGVEAAEVRRVVEGANERKNLGGLLKGMRGLLGEACKG
ncbi:hypothetical protein B0A48_02752 [Cryoendolithus antarcticus]|uniref:Kinetochore protein SPC25 n=1 Tax=Cryoendolithus antarcticus TaxID=1507870 RepID=A0A1V8TL59_9PEZI|nr:hypothetical protein B0A48_02752 [Cryoendolithus antarcticus]